MIQIQTLNGTISLTEQRKLTFVNGAYIDKPFLYFSAKTEREIADLKLNREQVQALISALKDSLLWP